LRVKKTQLFLKNFQTSKNELFQNSRKQKVWKFLSNAGPYDPKTGNYFQTYFQTIPKLEKTKSSENSVFRRAKGLKFYQHAAHAGIEFPFRQLLSLNLTS